MSFSKAMQHVIEHYGADHPQFDQLIEMHMKRGY